MPLGCHRVFKDLGMPRHTQLEWFNRHREGRGEIVRNPSVKPNDSLWGSFLIRTGSVITVFVSSDLAYFERFGEPGERKKLSHG
jgi:hypothetical protein